MPKSKLIFDEFYVIDEDRRLYKSIKDDGIYYRSPGGKLGLEETLCLPMIIRRGRSSCSIHLPNRS